VGRYHVNLGDLDSVGAQAISKAVEICNVVVIDEIGLMELFSERFKEKTQKALASSRIVLAVVHWKTSDKLANETKSREDSETFTITVENREKLPEAITVKVVRVLKSQQ
jgi:nucleoside-triphosphatase